MHKILIIPEDIQQRTKFMRDSQDRLDLLGQILTTGFEIKVHKHAVSPADQGTLLAPFTVYVRGRTHNTPLTLQLLRNADHYTPKKQIEQANILLEEHDIYLEEV